MMNGFPDMNTRSLPLPLLLCLLCLCGAPVRGQLKRPPGMPDNELIAFYDDDHRRSLNANDLADALGIMQWSFQIQVPDGTDKLQVALHLIENGSDRILGTVYVRGEKWDSTAGKVVPGSKQFRLLVLLSPVDTSASDPLRESAKLRLFAKEFQSGSRSSEVVDNPLRKHRGSITTFESPRLVRDRKVPSGVWDGFGTRFDLVSSDDEKRIVRISFHQGAIEIHPK
jgi:hypothetical protein